uniref:SAC3/GANP/THP3 conserved domain-containing protein n=1 Tax=Cryptomonas curvata TaxID=233186 RepID=A0A7S0M0R8_9CRYP|mmetsp:Transcript_1561/g.3229  ORF Transcript_1561/g.3229 Transcript_1561/m.3229 type:complete len:381 (+) Transcript_1561:76-1218(+)
MATTAPAKRLSDEGAAPAKKMVKLSSSNILNGTTVASRVPAASKVVKLSSSTLTAVACPVKTKLVKTNSASPIAIDGLDLTAEALEDRTLRFNSTSASTIVSLKGTGGPSGPPERRQLGQDGARAGGLKGTSTALERPYLRLHFEPDPSTIRPPHVLLEALSLVKRKWVEGPDYAHASEQLMSIQQDCRLQGLEGDLVSDAYETHARIAIERGELGDLSRTMSALSELYYAATIKGNARSPNCHEFIAYRMLYSMREEREVLENLTVLYAQLTAADRATADIAFAARVGQALLCSDYATFFRLYEGAPKMAGYIMDFFVDRVRGAALQVYLRSMGPAVEVDDLKHLLSFAKRKECFRFLRERGVVFTEDKRAVDAKASRA